MWLCFDCLTMTVALAVEYYGARIGVAFDDDISSAIGCKVYRAIGVG